MRFILPLAIFYVMIDSSWSQTTKELLKNIAPKTTEKPLKEDPISSTEDGNGNLKDLGLYKPSIHESRALDDHILRVKEVRVHSLTKLTKTVNMANDPYFNKGNFEPFEHRPNLVTLVAFRKNGLIPRRTIKISEKSSKVAELQSPFNGISNFWMEIPVEYH